MFPQRRATVGRERITATYTSVGLTQLHTVKTRAATPEVSRVPAKEPRKRREKFSLLPKDAWNPEGLSFPEQPTKSDRGFAPLCMQS